MKIVLWTAIIAMITAYLGLFMGKLLKYAAKNYRRVIAGFSGGTMSAFICFEFLPSLLEKGQMILSLSGVLIGILFIVMLEKKQQTKICCGINFYLLPMLCLFSSGLVLGVEGSFSVLGVIRLGILFFLFSISLGLEIPFFCYDKNRGIFLFLTISMLIGCILGFFCSFESRILAYFLPSFANGILLYYSCGTMIGENHAFWDKVTMAVGGFLGFFFGVFLLISTIVQIPL